jgi:hypothetical protein
MKSGSLQITKQTYTEMCPKIMLDLVEEAHMKYLKAASHIKDNNEIYLL